MSEKVLAAFVGGTQGTEFAVCGLLEEGCCVPLAATARTREIIEELDLTEFPNWFGREDPPIPPAGGLWVAEFELMCEDEEDDNQPCGFHSDGYFVPVEVQWRMPTPSEMAALFVRQRAQVESTAKLKANMDGCEPWVVAGALV